MLTSNSETPFREMLPSSRGEQDRPNLLHPAPGGALPFPLTSVKLQKRWCFPTWGQCQMQRSLDSLQRRSDSCWWPMICAFLGIHSRQESQDFFLSFCPILSSPETWWFSSLLRAVSKRVYESLLFSWKLSPVVSYPTQELTWEGESSYAVHCIDWPYVG